MAEQMGFDFGDEDSRKAMKADEARKKVREFVTSDPEYAKQLEKREEAKRQDAAMREKVKEMATKKAALAQSSMISPKGNTTAAGRGELSKGGGGGGATPKSNRDLTKNYRTGGKVSSASKRADGIATKGKTKGRMV
jgi:hypothetical protein